MPILEFAVGERKGRQKKAANSGSEPRNPLQIKESTKPVGLVFSFISQ